MHSELLESYRLLHKAHSNQSDMLIEQCMFDATFFGSHAEIVFAHYSHLK